MDFCIVKEDDISMEEFQDIGTTTSEDAILVQATPVAKRPAPVAPIAQSMPLHINNHYKEQILSSDEYDDDLDTTVETAIVGGGVSGLYCAWKMLTKDKNKDFILIEQSDELGGRLKTDHVEYSDDTGKCLKEEEGGMRFSSDEYVMGRLWKLIYDLKIKQDPDGQIVDFRMAPKGFNSNRNRFNGKNFTMWYAKENPVIWSNIFDLDDKETLKSPNDIGKEIYKRVMEHNSAKLLYYIEKVHGWGRKELDLILSQDDINFVNKAQDPSYWQYVRNHFTWSIDGCDTQLKDISMTALMGEMGYSYGCSTMLTQALGFICMTITPGNAGVVLQMLVTNNNIHPSLKCFKNGFGVLTKKLQYEIDSMTCGRKWSMLSTVVTKLAPITTKIQDDYKYRLAITPNGKAVSGVTIKKSIRAKNVILAIAQDSFIDLFTKPIYPGPSENALVIMPNAAINSVTGIQMVKINMYFDREWWNEGLKEKLMGPNTSNLPLGCVYPFYATSCPGDESKPQMRLSALTIYCDERNARFWYDLQRIGLMFKSELQQRYIDMQPASRPLVREALKQLGLLFNKSDVPQPILTTFKNWDGTWGECNEAGCRKYNGFAIHQWKIGVDDKVMMEKMVQPFKNEEIYCCNETWSDFQGWVEGSLRSSDLVLKAMDNNASA